MKKIFRYITATVFANFLIAIGLVKNIKDRAKRGDFILSIYFHCPCKALFEFCIKWLKKNNFVFLSQQDVLTISQKKMPFPKGGVIITVDDGWKTNEENIVAVANKYKIPVTIFVSTDPVEKGNFWWRYISVAKEKKLIKFSVEELKKVSNQERLNVLQQIPNSLQLPREALTVDQVKQISLSNFVTIGSHTVSHPVLIHCNENELHSELEISKKKIEEWLNKDVYCFAYPNGDFGIREKEYLKKTNYSLAYTTQPEYLTANSLENLYELPRFAIFENISKAEAVCRMLGIWQNSIKKLFKISQ